MVISVIKKKLVIVGDGDSGKTSLLMVFKNCVFPYEYIPTVFDNYVAEFELDGIPIELQMWDTAGQEDYDRLRGLSYYNVDVILVCFSIGQPASLENVSLKWLKEVRHFSPDVPIVLVGNKKDLRSDYETIEAVDANHLRPIDSKDGFVMANIFKACPYLECSALTGENVQEVFHTAVRVAINLKLKTKRKQICCIL